MNINNDTVVKWFSLTNNNSLHIVYSKYTKTYTHYVSFFVFSTRKYEFTASYSIIIVFSISSGFTVNRSDPIGHRILYHHDTEDHYVHHLQHYGDYYHRSVHYDLHYHHYSPLSARSFSVRIQPNERWLASIKVRPLHLIHSKNTSQVK